MTAATSTAAPSARLLDDFTLPTYEQWRAAAEALLKGAPFEKKLVTRTLEGIDLQPIYHPADVAHLPPLAELPGAGNRVRGARASGHLVRPWEISQELPCATPEEFNAAALHDLARGQTELNILVDLATLAGRDPDQAAPGEVGACGVSLATLADMERAFAGIHLPMISVYLRAGASALPAAALLLALARRRGVDPRELRGCIEVDPLGTLAWKGDLPVSLDRAYQEMAGLTHFAVRHAPALQTIAVTTHAWHDAGATAVQELGFALATGVAYLRALGARGLAIADAARHLRFAFSAGSNVFMEIAKLRAARQTWTQIVRALGGDDTAASAMHLHVRTATINKTVYDAHANILRGTTEAFAAVIGGCDSLHVGPFDEVIRVSDDFARRIARNTQVILAEECDLAHVVDPAGGSYYVEWLTDQVARRAWALFQDLERIGGMASALAAGTPQKIVAESAQARADAVAKRRAVIVGTNQYPNAREIPLDRALPDYAAIQQVRAKQIAAWRSQFAPEADVEVLNRLAILLESQPAAALDAAIDAVQQGATLGEITRTLRAHDQPAAPIPAVRVHRLAQPFERLRDAAARWRDRTGTPPLLFQANIGPSRLYRLRADWTTGFFEVGGFKVIGDRDFTGADDAAEAAASSGARLIVITATDETYAAIVEPFARALKARDAGLHVLVAGAAKDKEVESAWRAAGVNDFVNIASNALALLTRLLTRIGVLS